MTVFVPIWSYCSHSRFEFFFKKEQSAYFMFFNFLLYSYNAIMESWQLAFSWGHGVDFQIRDVRARVLSDMAWVTMQAYVDMETGPFNVTNAFEFHNGRWYMVHHHSSVILIHGGAEQQLMLG